MYIVNIEIMTKHDMHTLAKLYPNSWTCYDCITQILPIESLTDDVTTIIKTTTTEFDTVTTDKHTNLHNDPYPKVIFGDSELERVTNIKFLGAILTDTLNWTDHMLYITSKMNKSIGYFYRARAILDQKQLINLYHSFVEPYIIYCLPIWGGSINIDSKSNPITKVINRFKRIITFSKRTHTANDRISLPDLNQYYTLEVAKTVYTHITDPDNSPLIYHKTMTRVTETHNQATRMASHMNLSLPKFRNNYKKKSFQYKAAVTWNALPYPVKLKNNKQQLTDAVKRYKQEFKS